MGSRVLSRTRIAFPTSLSKRALQHPPNNKFITQFEISNLSRPATRTYRTEANVISSEPLEPTTGVTIPELIFSNLAKWENDDAFICSVTGRKYTHGQIFKQSRNFATALLQSGLKRNDVVAILLPNLPESPIAFMGIWEAGLIVSTLNPAYTSDEITKQLLDCAAKTIVTTTALLPNVLVAKKSCPLLKSVIVIGEAVEGCHSFFEMVKVNSSGTQFLKGSEINTLEDVALLPYSSGTTGPPKGVMLTHANVCTNIVQYSQPGVLASNDRDRRIGILPFYHIYGFSLVLAKTLYKGCYTSCIPKFGPNTFAEIIRTHKPNALHLVTPLINFMAHSADFGKKEFEPVDVIMGGAAPIGVSLIQKLISKAEKDFVFQEGYGMTEMSPVSHILRPNTNNTKIGSIGQVIPGTLCKVVDSLTGESLGPNKEGELCVKGAQNMKGYLNNEKATKETIDSEGWLHTGDIAYYGEDENFYIVDRLKELIKVKGLQVAPSELEDLLRQLPGVADVAVIGVPCERSGELPRAYVVKNNNVSITEKDIHDHLESKVSRHKKLEGGIQFVEIIPKAPSGKILRRELKADYLKTGK